MICPAFSNKPMSLQNFVPAAMLTASYNATEEIPYWSHSGHKHLLSRFLCQNQGCIPRLLCKLVIALLLPGLKQNQSANIFFLEGELLWNCFPQNKGTLYVTQIRSSSSNSGGITREVEQFLLEGACKVWWARDHSRWGKQNRTIHLFCSPSWNDFREEGVPCMPSPTAPPPLAHHWPTACCKESNQGLLNNSPYFSLKAFVRGNVFCNAFKWYRGSRSDRLLLLFTTFLLSPGQQLPWSAPLW